MSDLNIICAINVEDKRAVLPHYDGPALSESLKTLHLRLSDPHLHTVHEFLASHCKSLNELRISMYAPALLNLFTVLSLHNVIFNHKFFRIFKQQMNLVR